MLFCFKSSRRSCLEQCELLGSCWKSAQLCFSRAIITNTRREAWLSLPRESAVNLPEICLKSASNLPLSPLLPWLPALQVGTRLWRRRMVHFIPFSALSASIGLQCRSPASPLTRLARIVFVSPLPPLSLALPTGSQGQ